MQHRLQGTEATWDTSHLEAWGGVQGGTVTISARVLTHRTLRHPGTTGEIPKVLLDSGDLRPKGSWGPRRLPPQFFKLPGLNSWACGDLRPPKDRLPSPFILRMG